MHRFPLPALVLALLSSSCATRPDRPVPSAPREEGPRPWSVEDTLALVRIGDVELSPDGAWVLYSERWMDLEENDHRRAFFLAASDDRRTERRRDLDDAREVRFAPGGARISYLAETGGAEQVFVVGLHDDSAEQVTRHAGGVDRYAWSPDGARVYFTAEEPRDPAAQAEWDAGGDAVFVGEDGNGLRPQRWSNLWVHDLATGVERRLTDLEVTIGDLDVAPDGERVAFTACSDNRANEFWRSELYVADRRNGMVLQLTENEAPEESPTWSPDGRWIAYRAPDAERFDLRHGYLWLVDPLTGDARRLEGQHRGALRGFWWAPDAKSLLFGETRGVTANLFELDLASGEVRARTSSPGTLVVQRFSADGSAYAFTLEDHGEPADLWIADASRDSPVRLTNANPWVGTEVAVAPSEIVRWTSTDGREVEGVLTLPPHRIGASPLPLVLDIHGGPPDHWGARFEPEQQLLAASGYAVLAPNPRGSDSYGDEHLRALMGDVGGGEYHDLMSGVDALIARGVADPDRLALRGWSWGGVLGAWTITQTKRFRAASLGAMVGDWAAETGGGVMFDLRLHYIGSDPWEDREEWARRSALTHVANVVTPTLLLHGEEDDVSTVNQSQMFFTALRAREVPVRFVKFPRQGHDLDEPRLRRIALEEELRWFERHMLGERAPRRAREAEVAAGAESEADRGWLDAHRTLSADDEFFVARMEEARIPGLSAAVVKDGELLWSGAYGWADPAARIPVAEDTLFQLASVSKTVTATVVLQLVEAGALDLDADVNDVLPFPVRHPAHPDVPITTRMLLTHTAGLRDNWIALEGTWVIDGDYPLSLRDSIAAYFLPGGALHSAERSFQRWAPGARHRYANVGFALAALVAESAARMPFERLARDRVLAPLRIEGGYRLADVDVGRVAVPQRWSRERGFERLGHHAYLDFASGTLRLSAKGLARFLQAYQRGGELDGVRILRAETVSEMLRVQRPEIDEDQGLAWIRERLAGTTSWGHDGGDPGVATRMELRLEDGVGSVLLMNGEPQGRGAERRFVERLQEIGARAAGPARRR